MTTEQIINSGLNKTEKAKKLFELGLTRKEVSQLVLNGNYGFAQNIYAKWVVNQIINGAVRTSGFNFEFNRTFGVEIEAYGVDKNELVTAFQPSASAEQYMVDYAARAETYDGSIIASHSWEAFIECLLLKQHIRAV